MNAILVARVSTDEQKEAGNSLPAQLERMRKYCKRKKYVIEKEFEFSESAYKNKRDKFDEVVEYVKNAKSGSVVCFDKVDRFSRNAFDERIPLLCELATAGKIEIHFTSDGQIISASTVATGKFQFHMTLGLSRYFSDAISDNVIRSNEEARRQGKWLGVACLGYANITLADGSKSIALDPTRTHLVKKIFEMYAQGTHSMESIRRVVTDEGLRSRYGGVIQKSGIENILRNPFYSGTGYSKKYNLLFPHQYPTLISKELFDACQRIREGKRQKPFKTIAEPCALAGLISCVHCGCRYTPERKVKDSGRKYVYYSCTNGKKNCKRIYVPEKVFLGEIYQELKPLGGLDEQTQKEILAYIRQTVERDAVLREEQLGRLGNEIEHTQQKKSDLLDFLLDKRITQESYDKKMQELDDALQRLEQKVQQCQKTAKGYQSTMDTIVSLASRASEIIESSEPHEKQRFLKFLLQNPKSDGTSLEVSLKKSFKILAFTCEAKRKTMTLASNRSSWLHIANDIGTAIREHKGYIHIPKLTVADCV